MNNNVFNINNFSNQHGSAWRNPNPQEFLETLHFRTMDDRYEEIQEAHGHTFQWILDSSVYEDLEAWFHDTSPIL